MIKIIHTYILELLEYINFNLVFSKHNIEVEYNWYIKFFKNTSILFY